MILRPTHTRPGVKISIASLVLKSGDGQTTHGNIVITTNRVWVGLEDNFAFPVSTNSVGYVCLPQAVSLDGV